MKKVYLWVCFLFLALITGAFCCLSLVTFNNVYKVYDKVNSNAYTLRGVLAAAFMAGMLTLLFNILSFCILLGKTFANSGAGFSYGFVCASCIHLSFTVLLAGLVLNAFRDSVENLEKGEVAGWSKGDTVAFHATYAFAYICFALLFLFFFLLMVFKNALRETLEGQEGALCSARTDGRKDSDISIQKV